MFKIPCSDCTLKTICKFKSKVEDIKDDLQESNLPADIFISMECNFKVTNKGGLKL